MKTGFYMLADLETIAALPDPGQLAGLAHVLVVLPAADALPPVCPDGAGLAASLARRGKGVEALRSGPLAATVGGGLRAWLMLDPGKPRFAQLTALRKAFALLLEEQPAAIDVLIDGDSAFVALAAELAAYVGLANGAPLPTRKKKDAPKALARLTLWGCGGRPETAVALAEASLVARSLTALPPNVLTPGTYRDRLADMADEMGWDIEEFDRQRLAGLGAGAFLAVVQGSSEDDAAIVRLSYEPADAVETVALVGKGICFDSGGHNLKPAKYMAGMHEDMAGSAVVLGILLAATRLRLPLAIDAWLALARNDISAAAYRQGDIVTALDGTAIEVVHTDAEGRMVLADALALAVRDDPDLVIDFATLTGSMVTALGTRYAGVLTEDAGLATAAVAAGRLAGERVCAFPMDDDYESELESKVADVKQCTLDGEADHILAARFLKRFVGDLPWLHVDLAAAACKGGLGAIGSDQTGFGVAWGLKFLTERLQSRNRAIPGSNPAT